MPYIHLILVSESIPLMTTTTQIEEMTDHCPNENTGIYHLSASSEVSRTENANSNDSNDLLQIKPCATESKCLQKEESAR